MQLRAKMERLFWEQLIVSLTPSTQASTDDLTAGAVGQVRTHAFLIQTQTTCFQKFQRAK
jgi:hypothetical protein